MTEVINTDNYEITPPCTDCVHYEPCKRHSQQLAAISGHPSYDVELVMASGDGVCDMFLPKRKFVATYEKQSPNPEILREFHEIGARTQQ